MFELLSTDRIGAIFQSLKDITSFCHEAERTKEISAMKSAYQTLRSSQPALGPNERDGSTQDSLASIPVFEDNTSIYYQRAHEARSEAFRDFLAHLPRLAAQISAKLEQIGNRIHSWLFTPFYSGNQKL